MNLIIEQSKRNTLLPEILQAAVKLFVDKSIEGTTTKDIAHAAGVSEGALYRHFKSKDELAWYIFSTHLNDFSMKLMGEVSKQKHLKQKIHAFVSTCFRSFEEDSDLFTYLIASEHREFRSFSPTSVHIGTVALKMVEEGQKAGEVKPMDLYIAGSIIVGTVIRICIVRGRDHAIKNLEAHIDEVSESLWHALNNK
jgi:hypothetical protein